MYHLLVQSARLHGDDTYYRQLAQQAPKFTEWTEVLALSEAQGLGPLLYRHLQAAGVQIPLAAKQQLQGLYLRHRHANRVRAQVLAEILAIYQAAGIQAFVLKGAALAHLVYPEPGLRPMRDIDLLVQKSEVRQAQQLLSNLGFTTPLPGIDRLPDKHLGCATLERGGFLVSVEIHHRLFSHDLPVPFDWKELVTKPLFFSLTDVTAYTLSHEAMLWHLCRHVTYHANVWEPMRLIWVADIVGFAERFAPEIDWERIEQQYPFILNILALFHHITPLSDNLRRLASLKVGHPPQGVAIDFQGWPRSSLARQHQKGYKQLLYDTFLPSEWWLRLRYGLGPTHSLFWYRWLYHPLYILGRVRQLWFEKRWVQQQRNK